MMKIKRVRAEWREVILVCRKCSKRLGGGFGETGKESLAKVLRRELDGKGKGRKGAAGVIEIGCLDICPKRAVVVLAAARPSAWAVVPKGADLAGVTQFLGIGAVGPGE